MWGCTFHFAPPRESGAGGTFLGLRNAHNTPQYTCDMELGEANQYPTNATSTRRIGGHTFLSLVRGCGAPQCGQYMEIAENTWIINGPQLS